MILDIYRFYKITGLVMTFFVIVGDLWLSLNIESMKYSFFIFLFANLLGIIHFYLTKAYSFVLFCLLSCVINIYALYNYFDYNIYLVTISSIITSLLIIIIFHIFKGKSVRTKKEASGSLLFEYIQSFSTLIGLFLISLNNEILSLIGFSIWLFFTPLGFIVANNIKSKGLFYQVLLYFPIEVIAIYSYSNDHQWVYIFTISALLFCLIYKKIPLKYSEFI
jgi:hypothetical protein